MEEIICGGVEMLKKVVFIWKKENLIKDMTALLREMSKKHIEAVIKSADCEEEIMENMGGAKNKEEQELWNLRKKLR